MTEDYHWVGIHKYLGVILDSEIQFQLHTQQVIEKSNLFCGLAGKARNLFSRRQMVCFYDACVKSRILYGVLIYGNTSDTTVIVFIGNFERRKKKS